MKDVLGEMNARGDSSNLAHGQAGKRLTNREDAFGMAVPKGTKINKGLDGPKEEQTFPEEDVVTRPQEPLVDEMADFLHMERLGDEGLGGGVGYAGQAWDGQ